MATLLWGELELPRLLVGIGESNLPFKNCFGHLQTWVSMGDVTRNHVPGKGT